MTKLKTQLSELIKEIENYQGFEEDRRTEANKKSGDKNKKTKHEEPSSAYNLICVANETLKQRNESENKR